MANNDDLKIIVTAKLDEKLSTAAIQKQLDSMSDKLKLNIGIDPKQIKDINSAINNIQNQTNKSGKGIKIIDENSLKTSKEFFTNAEGIIKHFEKLGTVKLTKVFDGATEDIKAFNLEIQKADGLIEKLKLESAQSKGVHGIDNGFIVTKREELDKRSIEMQKALTKTLTDRQRKEKELAEAQDKAINKNIELTQKEKQAQEELNKEIQRQLYLYQETKKLQAQDLTRRYADAVDKNVLGNQVAKLDVDPSSFQSLKQLRDWQDDIDLGFKKISSTVKSSSSHVLTFGEALKTAMVKFPIWMVASTAFFQSLRFFSDGISYVNELNKALTEISVVTGMNQQQVAELGQEYNKLAMEMGVLTTEVARASVEFYRQGLSQEEVMKRVSTATQYAKISNLDFKKSSEILTATVNSMGISIERAADVYSYLGDATATGADEIGIAYQKLGGSASAVNLEFEKGASWIAVLSSRTREGASTIGQSIKSILARVQSLKENGFAEEDGTSVNEVAKALSQVNIQLMDSSGNFRNFGDVMDQLGQSWKNLDSRTKAYLATTIAGNYQQSRFQNLMEGYADTIPLYEQALQSAGNTQQKFDQYLQGTEAHLNKLVTVWHGVWQSAFDSEAIRTGIDLLTSVTTGVKNVVDTFGIIPPVLTTAGMAFLLFNGGLKTTMMNGTLVLNTLRGLPVGFKTLDSSMSATILKTRVLNGTLATLSATANMTKRAVVGAMTFTSGAVLPVAGFLALGFAIQKLTENLLEAKQAQEQVRKEQENMMDSYKSRKEDVQSLANEFERLSKVQNERKFNVDEEKRFTELQNELGKILPTVVSGLDNKGNSLIESSEAIREQIGVLEELIQLEKDKARLDAPSKLKEGYSKIDELKEQLKYEQDVIASKKEQQKVLLDDKDHTRAEALAVEQDIQEWLIKQKITQTQINAEAKKNAENFKVFFDGMKLDDSVVKQVTEIMSAFDLGGKDIGQIEGVVLSVVDAVKQLNTAMDSGNAEGIKKAKDNLDGIITTYAKGKVNTNEFTNALDKNTDSQNSNNQAKSEASQKQSELNKQQEESISTTERLVGITEKQLSTIQGAIATYQLLSSVESDSTVKSQELTDAITILSNAYPHLVNGKELNIEAIQKEVYANEVLMEAIDMLAQGKLTQEQTMSLIAAQQSKQRMEILNKELQFLQEVINKFNDVADGINAQGQKLSDRALSEGEKLAVHAVQKAAKIKVDLNVDTEKYNTKISSLAKSIDFKGYGVPDTKKDPKDKKSDSKSTKDPITQYVSDEYQKSVDKYNLKLDESKSKQDKATESSEEYRKQLTNQSAIYRELINLTDDELKRLNQRNGVITRALDGMGSFNTLSEKQKEKYNELKKELDENTKSVTNLKKSNLDYQKSIDEAKIAKATSIQKQAAEQLEKTLEKVNKQLTIYEEKVTSIDNELSRVQKTMSLYEEGSSEYNTLLKEQISLFTQKETQLKTQKRVIEALIATEGLSIEKQKELQQSLYNVNMELLDLQVTANEMKNSLRDSIGDNLSSIRDDYIEGLKSELERLSDSLNKEIESSEKYYDNLIEKQQERLDALDEEIEKEDRLKKLREIADEINNVKQDKRYEFITENGEKILTYDTAKVAELEKQQNELKEQYQREDIKKAIQDEIDYLENAKKTKLDNLRDELEQLTTRYNDMISLEEKRWNSIIEEAQKGTITLDGLMNGWFGQSIGNLSTYVTDLQSYVQQIKDAYASLGSVSVSMPTPPSNTDSLKEGNPLGMSESDFDKYVQNKKTASEGAMGSTKAAKENEQLRKKYGIDKDMYTYDDLKKYHIGGVVGGTTNRLTDLANKLFNTKPNEQVIKSLVGELQVPPNNIVNNFIPNMQRLVGLFKKDSSPTSVGDTFHIGKIEVVADNPMDLMNGLRAWKRNMHT